MRRLSTAGRRPDCSGGAARRAHGRRILARVRARPRRDRRSAAQAGQTGPVGSASSRSAACSTRSWSTSSSGRSPTPSESDAVAVVLQMNSGGSVVSDSRIAALARTIHDSRVPGRRLGRPVRRPGARCAPPSWPVSPTASASPPAAASGVPATSSSRGLLRPAFARRARPRIESGTLGAGEALRTKVAVRAAPVIGEFIVGLPGVKTQGRTRGRPATSPDRCRSRCSARCPSRINSSTPWPARRSAYLLFVIGMALIIFELFTAGVGVAGLVGAGLLRARLLRAGRAAHEPGRRSPCWCWPWSPSPSTCRPVCPGSGPPSARSVSPSGR